ncbi:MAG TPA: hypothetical protein VFS67_33595 [Polyangiaceae bacterium]|nr:hypothetical protein [Polyangiaceae bacterium]
MSTRWLSWLVAGCAFSCGVACGDDARQGAVLPPPYAPPPVPLAGCEQFDYGGCDVRERTCVENLSRIAACLWGTASAALPALSFASEQQAHDILLDSLAGTAPPRPDYFALVLAQLGLSEPSAFEPEVTAARLAQRWAAFYRRDVGEVVVIEHAQDPDPLSSDALVLHELIHALQDREHGLEDFARQYQSDSDGNLRGQSVVEGEAQFHEQRLYAALTGVDAASVDWPAELAAQRESSEQQLFQESDLYSASLLRVPYAHGCEHAARVWSEGGPGALRGLLEAPPRDMREILARLWGGAEAQPALSPVGPSAVGASAQLQAWSRLGAWGVYLFFRPRLGSLEAARELALGWRGDRVEAYALSGAEVAGRWSIDFADDAAATRALAAAGSQPRLWARREGRRLRIETSSGAAPPAELTP